MLISRIAFLIFIAVVTPASYACESTVSCSDCSNDPEFGWNPSNEHVTERLNRFYELGRLIEGAYDNGDVARTKSLASEYLELAHIYRCNWNFGNAIHEANRILGLIAVNENNFYAASDFLRAAGKTRGSPQLNSFGPDFTLANSLLAAGNREVVVEYLADVRRFWEGHEDQIDAWISVIEAGDEVFLDRSALSGIQLALAIASALWPVLLIAAVWYRFRNRLSNKWAFPIVALGFSFFLRAMGNLAYVALVLGLVDVFSSQVMSIALVVLAILVEVGAPLLGVYLALRMFNKSEKSNIE